MPPLDLAGLNDSDAERLRGTLVTCLAVPRWVDAVLAGRPYAGLGDLLATADAAAPLRPDEIHAAMAAHPRIGEKAAGGDTGANWSRSEQSGVDGSTAAAFAAANAAYERRFGHVYLVCASGRGGAELLADLRARMDNEPEAELAVAGRELIKIAHLRLEKAVTA